MIQLLFSLRYQSQIRRTSPVLYNSLEAAIKKALEESGGEIARERRCIVATFDDNAAGFWLDMLVMLETVHRALKDASPELFGFILLLSRNLEDYGVLLARELPSGGSGIWCGSVVRKALAPWADFEKEKAKGVHVSQGADFSRLAAFRGVSARAAAAPARTFPLRDRIMNLLRQSGERSMLLEGPRFIGKRDSLRRHAKELLAAEGREEYAPPLIITFGAGGRGLCCVTDALRPEIRKMIAAGERGAAPGAKNAGVIAELENLASGVARERFQDQYPPHAIIKARRFLSILFDVWEKTMRSFGARPVLLLENLNEADGAASEILAAAAEKRGAENRWLVFGTWSSDGVSPDPPYDRGENSIDFWRRSVFPRVVQISVDENAFPPPPAPMIRDLLETAYALELFRRYFPPSLIPGLFREAGVNPAMIAKALSLLFRDGIIDSTEDPQIRIAGFMAFAEQTLGNRREYIQRIIRDRILAWAEEGKFRPSWRLLEALRALGGLSESSPEENGKTGDASLLILNALRSDIANGVTSAIERAIAETRFSATVGNRRTPALLYIYTTQKALNGWSEAAIREVFREGAPDTEAYPVYRAQICANLASFHFGFRNGIAAEEMVKQCLLLVQGRREGDLAAQGYRLFSLVSISRQRLSDAIEYLAFAKESSARQESRRSEKVRPADHGASGSGAAAQNAAAQNENVLAAFYAAVTSYLYGNISRAIRLAAEAEETALFAGRLEWADRARFFQGRLFFETGRYQEAQGIFESLAGQGGTGDRAAVLDAWSYRSRVFQGEADAPYPEKSGIDGRFFRIEAAWFRGDYELAISLADRLSGEIPENRFVFIERPDWWSGFAQCEYLIFQPGDFISRLAASYRALALCRLDRKNGGSGSEAPESMRRVIREEGMSQADPNDAFYYFARYCVLEESGAVEVDLNTTVSIAFKRLQSRASHIDDNEIKRLWLTENRWNGALSQAARKHRLI